MPCLFWLLLSVLCCWFWWVCWQRPRRRGKLSSRLPQLFFFLWFAPLHHSRHTILHSWTHAAYWLTDRLPHLTALLSLWAPFTSPRVASIHMCHGYEPAVTACSYFPQLLTIALYLRDSIWSKLDSFILLYFGRAGYLTPLGGALLNIHWREGETAHARTDAVLHAYSWMDRNVFSNSCRRMYIFDSAQVCH